MCNTGTFGAVSPTEVLPIFRSRPWPSNLEVSRSARKSQEEDYLAGTISSRSVMARTMNGNKCSSFRRERDSQQRTEIYSSQSSFSISHLTLEMQRFLTAVTEAIVGGLGWKKFINPTVTRGSTAWPRDSGEQEKHGVRYDYDGEQEIDGTVYHKFQMQANAGNKIPSTIKKWRSKADRGTHVVMADVFVPRGGGKDDVEAALKKAHEGVKGA
ncbi:hypothetical protein DACRYDRAFT_25209 [Dacryopinax primogenitus]|uniref:Uncharacterized protein n=1 Tax=Dacryopinax primogenitus (strain DJM 731) TaxID=1858805 RepID=M5FUW4_DACPD|nr:uncharacterized protein DACRYDRAFT_25209 [Dacryopinax primogenitus]EJT97071.1 hypothetical protein DACRYDRAFT_25209 [Dacryopinax primogenitus]